MQNRLKILLILFLPNLAFGQYTPGIISFNAGEVSPLLKMRSDFAKYDNACIELENMLVLTQGPVERRPGTKYIAQVKTSGNTTRLIPFEYSKTDAYILEFGDLYMRVYRNGGQVLSGGSAYDINTPFLTSEVAELQYAQRADTMYIVHPNHPPQKLTRTGHTSWTIADAAIVTGPFLAENETTATLTPSATTGTITITASTSTFTENHVGSIWQIRHRREEKEIHGTLASNTSSATISCYGDYYFTTHGTWTGTITLERSFDAGSTWEAVATVHSQNDDNRQYEGSEDETGVIYRVTMSDFSGTGPCTYNFSIYDYMSAGIAEITVHTNTTTVTATVLDDFEATTASTYWSEGYWSDENGWPETVCFHEQRLMFAGSASYPQTIWASKTADGSSDDYVNFTEGTNDNDALIYVLPGQNPIQWMTSQTYVLIGTLAGVGRWGSAEDDTPITPTEPTNYREQARYGAAYIQPVLAGDSILYVERGGERIREFAYNLERDRFIAPDMTVLAEHITGTGITQIAYQTRPDSIVWCIRDDGVLLSLTYNREQDVIAWARHTTEGSFESVGVIPGDDEDEVWLIVNRTINGSTVRYIEQMQPRTWTAQADCFFVDSGLSFDGGSAQNITNITQANPAVVTVATWPTDVDGTNLADNDQIKIVSVSGMTEVNGNVYTVDSANVSGKTFALRDSTDSVNINSSAFTAYTSGGTVQRVENTFTNLSHLEAQGLGILADGRVLADETVSSGSITIDEWANTVHAGLDYTSQLETMPLVVETRMGLSAGKTVRISAMLVNFYQSLSTEYGTDSSNVSNVIFYESGTDLGEILTLYSGWRSLSYLRGHYRETSIYFQQQYPMPFTCRAIIPKIQIYER